MPQAYLEQLGVSADQQPAAFAVIDKLERQPEAVSDERLAAAGIETTARAAILRIPATPIDEVATALAGTEASLHVENFRRFQAYVAALTGDGDAWLRFDLSIVRGLAYYTGIVFELFDAIGEFRAIAGGGRYDNLLGALGGVELPALGFGMGDVVLGELLRARGKLGAEMTGRTDFWVGAEDHADLATVMNVVRQLRERGLSCEYALRSQSFDKQRKAARAAGVKFVLVMKHGFAENDAIELIRLPVFPAGVEALAPDGGRTANVESAFATESPITRFRDLLAQGWTDAIRSLHPDETIYTFWDYWRNAWARNAGLRIDHLLLNPAEAPRWLDTAAPGSFESGDPEVPGC